MRAVLRKIRRWLVSLFKAKPQQQERSEGTETSAPGEPSGHIRPEGAREAGDQLKLGDQGLRTKAPAKALYKASPLSNDLCQRLRQTWRYIAYGEQPPPIPGYRGTVEDPVEYKTGICCSGGGIRSAAFNLGALQALQECEQRELQRAHYLAAVSGGSYICAAYSMVSKTWGEPGTKRPSDDADKPYNGYDDSDPDLLNRMHAFARLSPEEQYLRNNSSYMAPTGMDKVFLGIRILLGLAFNLFFIGLPIAVATVVLGILVYAPSDHVLRTCTSKGCSFHPTPAWWLPSVILAGAGLFVAASRVVRRPPSDNARKASEIWSTRLLLFAAVVAVVTLALPAVFAWSAGTRGVAPTATSKGAAASGLGFAGIVAGLIAFAREAFSAAAKAAKDVGAARMWLMKLSKPVRGALIGLAGAVAGPLLLFGIAVLALSATMANYPDHRGALWIAAIAGGGLFALLYLFADLTSLSLHPFYKRRLSTAYALKRVTPKVVGEDRAKAGLEQEKQQGIAVEREYDRAVPLSKTALDAWPSLIVCAAANISDPGATPPGRHVTSFTFSANTIGGPLVGAMKTRKYEHVFDKRKRDFSLPAAVAMSGAAISPSMGKMSKPAWRFLLALGNVRLGVWVPNPRWVAGASERQRGLFKQPRPSYLIRELLGRNRVDGKYLFVTDGGHYENLGLVELLRRGCTRVFCFDASGGEGFKELGDAVALARSELGVKIEIDPTPLMPTGDPPVAKRAVTTGWIHYPSGHKGHLVYARNVMAPGGPWDVRAHQLENPSFPHDSTIDQLYTDQKFESYRALGAEAGVRAAARMNELLPRPPAPKGGAADDGPPPHWGLPPQRVREMLEVADIQLVDVRESFEFELARIGGAVHIEASEVHAGNGKLRQDRPVVFQSAGGTTSRKLAHDFRNKGWTAFYVEGGFRRWIDDGLPVANGKPK